MHHALFQLFPLYYSSLNLIAEAVLQGTLAGKMETLNTIFTAKEVSVSIYKNVSVFNFEA